MTRLVGRNVNRTDESTVNDPVTIPGDVAIVAIVAREDRMYLAITVTVRDAFVRLIPAATDNTVRKGILVAAGQTYELAIDNVYTGEVSIINTRNNDNPIFFLTEY